MLPLQFRVLPTRYPKSVVKEDADVELEPGKTSDADIMFNYIAGAKHCLRQVLVSIVLCLPPCQ